MAFSFLKSIAGLSILLAACSQSPPAFDALPIELSVHAQPIARCMNMGNALESPDREGKWGYIIRKQDLEMLKTYGFDTVRVPIRWSAYAQDEAPFEIDADFFNRVDEVVGWSIETGLNVIINVHHYGDLNDEPDQHETRLAGMWEQISARYAEYPDGLIFEIINEPNNEMTQARTDALNQRILASIRQDNPSRWVILGTAQWGNLEGLEKSRPEYDPRAILTYHDYGPFNFTHQGAFWTDPVPPTGTTWGSSRDRARMSERLDRALAFQTQYRMPVFVGEFGVFEGVPDEQRAVWIKAVRQGLETRGMGWCHWDFATTLRAYDTRRERWLPEILDALVGD